MNAGPARPLYWNKTAASLWLLFALGSLRVLADIPQLPPTASVLSDPLCGQWMETVQEGAVTLRILEMFAADGGYRCRVERSQPGRLDSVRFGGRWCRVGPDALIQIESSEVPTEVAPGQAVAMRAVETSGDQLSYGDEEGRRFTETRVSASRGSGPP